MVVCSGWSFQISPEELRKALEEIDLAEKHGFHYCKSVFQLTEYGTSLRHRKAEYCDINEAAHPTDGGLAWGRGQHVSRDFLFEDGKLVPLTERTLNVQVIDLEKELET